VKFRENNARADIETGNCPNRQTSLIKRQLTSIPRWPDSMPEMVKSISSDDSALDCDLLTEYCA
jgi:hypothetical protein